MIESLPDDVVLIIFYFLRVSDWHNVRLVNKSWSLFRLTSHNHLWSSSFASAVSRPRYEPIKSSFLEQVVNVSMDREKLLILKGQYETYRAELLKQRQEAISSIPPGLDRKNHRYFGSNELDQYLARYRSKSVYEHVKAVVVGDSSIGKTCLQIRLGWGTFPDLYIPTIMENHEVVSNWGNCTRNIEFWDTAGASDYDILRPLVYPNTDIFLICFSVSDRQSFENIWLKWMPEIMKHWSDAIFILVGTKVDLRETLQKSDAVLDSVDPEEAEFMAKHHGFALYIETSALTGHNLGAEFTDTIAKCSHLAQVQKAKPKNKCVMC